MKNKLIASVFLIFVGGALLSAAYQFAPLAHNAPATPDHKQGSMDPTVLEFAYGLPAVIFTVAGTASVVAGVVVASVSLIIKQQDS